jgi:hypothetical protein
MPPRRFPPRSPLRLFPNQRVSRQYPVAPRLCGVLPVLDSQAPCPSAHDFLGSGPRLISAKTSQLYQLIVGQHCLSSAAIMLWKIQSQGFDLNHISMSEPLLCQPAASRRPGPSTNWTTKGEDVLHPRLVCGRSLETDTTCQYCNTAIFGQRVCSVLHTGAEFSRAGRTQCLLCGDGQRRAKALSV